MKTALQRTALGFGLLFATSIALAQSMSPAGLWKTIDDSTKKEKSFVRIVEANGVYTGKVEKLLDPATAPDATCKDCSDERKGQPILGMTIIRNVKATDDKAVFSGGDILDPDNGKVYRVKLRVVDNGAKLDVRGYIGTPLLGRTQTWIRAE
ncbi:MAG: DUF2147 domain-containing protein [Caldimonas sp.]